jgi:multiple sugar transport system substrate-binding protein
MPLRLAAFLITFLTLAGCGKTNEGGTIIELWAMGSEGAKVQQLLPEFELTHPGLRVKVQQIPWSAAHEKLLTAYAGGNLPDVVQLGSTWIAEFVAIGALRPLDDLQSAAGLPLDDYYPATLEANRLDGKLYALPWYVDTRVLFYRKDLLGKAGYSQAPTTWQQWLIALHQVQTAKLAGYGLLLSTDEWELPTALAWQTGSSLLRDNDRYSDFHGDAFDAAFRFCHGLFQHPWVLGQSTSQMASLPMEFGRGYFAAFISGPWNVGELRQRLPAALQKRWATAPMPAMHGSEPGLSLANGASLAISRHSHQPQAAWALLEFLAQPAQQARFYQLTGDLPPRRSAWSDPILDKDPALDAFQRQLPYLRAAPKVPEWERIASKIGQYTEQTVRGLIPLEQALEALDRDADQILAKRRWLLEQAGQGK